MFKLRSYQTPSFRAIKRALKKGVNRGSIYASTGSGKTEIFKHVIKHVLDSKSAARILVIHPRIALSVDQQDRFKEDFKVPFTSFHSGKVIQNTTSEDEINVMNRSARTLDQLNELMNHNNGHIVFTSYNSVGKIAAEDWDIIICDEAHYLTQVQFAANIDLFKSPTFFFTATPVSMLGENDMRNANRYGEILAEITPAEMIQLGYNVIPDLHYTKVTTDKKGQVECFSEVIARTFVAQEEMLHADLTHKMLVAMPDTMAFDSIMEDLPSIREIAGDVDVYYVTGKSHVMNGVLRDDLDRAAFLTLFKDSTDRSIIIHCDTLAEGIDIDGLTGALINRNLGQAKFIQTIGRVVRPYAGDLKADYTPKAESKRKKTRALINCVIVDGQSKGNPDLVDWYNALFGAGYPMVKEIMNVQDNTGGTEESGEYFELQQSKILDCEFERAMTVVREEVGAW
jgi:superfamily II DNA or RNA helicase